MTLTESEPPVTTAAAVVSVRIPDESDVPLTIDAQRRIEEIDGVRAATVDGIEGLDPRLSATVVTIAVTIEGTASVGELREQLTSTVCIETLHQLTSSHG
jgi:hypothetical protein